MCAPLEQASANDGQRVVRMLVSPDRPLICLAPRFKELSKAHMQGLHTFSFALGRHYDLSVAMRLMMMTLDIRYTHLLGRQGLDG